MHSILNIPVSHAQLQRWSRYLAPARQPFFLTPEQARPFGLTLTTPDPSPEERDTFQLWNVGPDQAALLNEADYLRLTPAQRAELLSIQREHRRGAVEPVGEWRDLLPEVAGQSGGERFVWWPSVLAGREPEILGRVLARDRLPCLHAEVPESLWNTVLSILPRARELAGTFVPGSGPNCFGTVMAAAGVSGAENVWMQREPFEAWLLEYTRPTPEPAPGSVLIWRSATGQVDHAAAVLGADYVLHKPSQGWDSPRQVVTLAQLRGGWGAASEVRGLAVTSPPATLSR
ncbi:hypothetical protein [Deinococcus sp.]|uniref:hypothetical protein n=1 Tax=Deinococcus sp. TaxID=47478 RepID=UPI0025F64BBC|nr:hypothetical protein [Deinococcus sp.]